ncbi:Hypothetical predicted protein [Cloeon dipterum]|uniref:Uncharacterized protein n=1 Tax=Cloeon dipterum TaxID=197152 RepID=A0A8S1D250_9INSE|nr:Hypothetical predicted protein [Cloeon dipterum]
MELVPATAEAGWSVYLFEEPKRAVYAIPDKYVSEDGDKAYWPPHKELTKCYSIMRKNSYPELDWPTYKGKVIKKGKTSDEAFQNARKCRETLKSKNKITTSDCETTDLDAKRKGKAKKMFSPSAKSKKNKIVPLPEPPTTESVKKDNPDGLFSTSGQTNEKPEVRSKEIQQHLRTSQRKEDLTSSWRANLQRSLPLVPDTPPTPSNPTFTTESPKSVGFIEATPSKSSPSMRKKLSPVKRDLSKELEEYHTKKRQYEAGINVAKEKANEDTQPKTPSSPKVKRNTDMDVMHTLKGINFPMDTTTFQKYIISNIIHIKNVLQSLQAAPALEASLENGVFQMGNFSFPLQTVAELKVLMTTLLTDVSFCKKLKAFLVKRVRKLKHEFAPSLAAENILRKGTLPWLFSTNLVASTNITTIKTFPGSDTFFQVLYDVLSESGIGISRKEKVISLCGLHFRRIGSRHRDKEKKHSGTKISSDAGLPESLATKKVLDARRGLMSSPMKGSLRTLGLMRLSPSKQANAKRSSRKLTPGDNGSPKPLLSPNKRNLDSSKKQSISTANISEEETGIESQNQESDCDTSPQRGRQRKRSVTKKIGTYFLSSDEEILSSKKSRRSRKSSSDESIQENRESFGDSEVELSSVGALAPNSTAEQNEKLLRSLSLADEQQHKYDALFVMGAMNLDID